MIELQELSKHYDGSKAVDRVSLVVAEGEFLVLLGGSGSGKTTTLKMINRLIEPTSGRILLDGEDVTAMKHHLLRRKIGYVFQEIGLFPHMTIAENIGITPSLMGWDRPMISQRVNELIELVELDPEVIRDRLPSELSGGQQQRVGVARALAARPRVMLFDEPFGALDPLTRENLQQSVLRLRSSLALTAVFVTHDMTEAMLIGDRIAVLEQGRLIQVGTPAELMHSPATSHVEQLMQTPRRQARIVEDIEEGESS